MGDLPKERSRPAAPFEFTTVDLFGPYLVKDEVKKRVTMKVWGIVFSCLVSRAIHTDLVSTLSTESFLMAYKRFTALRGHPRKIWSDPGTNFIGAKPVLKELYQYLDSQDKATLEENFAQNRTEWEWKIQPADSPHRNGAAEAAVRIIKKALQSLGRETGLTYSELLTTVQLAANLANERPIDARVQSSEESVQYVTPNSLLLGRASLKGDVVTFNHKGYSFKRLQEMQNQVNKFWKAWSQLAGPNLFIRSKWHTLQRNVAVGDIVWVCDQNALRGHFKLGRVISVKPDARGVVRDANIRTVSSCCVPATVPGPNQPTKVLSSDIHPTILHRDFAQSCVIIPAITGDDQVGGVLAICQSSSSSSVGSALLAGHQVELITDQQCVLPLCIKELVQIFSVSGKLNLCGKRILMEKLKRQPVKVVLRVSRMLSDGQFQPPVLRIDPSRKRVIVIEPASRNMTHSTMTLGRENRNPLKTFSFDAAYSQDCSQAELCAGVLTDVIRCVLSGSDGCILGLGCADVGSWSSMVGSGENIQKLGLIPCAISWLYGAIERRREKTWTELSVSVSAIELCCGEEDTLRDLLGEMVPSSGSTQDSPKAHVRVQEDPVCGIQIRNHNRVKAPTAERAASLLDAAIAARRHADFITYLCHSSIMFFTLYVQPPRTESSTIGKGSRGTAKLTMIDVCSGMRGVNRNKLPHAELGPIVVSLLNGHKTLPNKSSKLNMLLRESLAHANCHTAVIAQVADSLAHHQETFSTIQIASRIRRTQKRTKQSTSCSPCGRSLTKEHKVPRSTLRAFHSTDEVDVDIRPLRLRGDLDRSSSDHSCDTVIQIDSDGSFRSQGVPTPAQPEFVPIIPSLHPNKTDLDDPEFTALLQELLRIPQLHGVKKAEDKDLETLKGERKQPERECLKCDTFAELQKRLGCIDGSELSIDALKSSLKAAACNNVLPESVHPKETSTAPQSSSNHGAGGGQRSPGAKQTDGALSGENFPREDSGLYDCEECSGTSSSEELLNQTLGMNSIGAVRTSNDVSLQESNTQGKSTTTSSILTSTEKPLGHEAADWFKPDKRASPVGKSSSISPSSSCFSSNSLTKGVILGDVLPNPTPDESKAMKATITVTVQQPLDLKGQDELVFSMVEEVTINGAYGRGKTAGNVFCIREPAPSRAENTSSTSQPIRIISDVSEDSATAGSSDSQPPATDANNEKPVFFRREKGTLPSFLNPMLMETDLDNLEAVKDKIIPNKRSETVQLKCDSHSNHDDKSHRTASPEKLPNNKEKEDKDFYNLESKMCEKRLKNADGSHGSACKHLHSPNNGKVSKEGGIARRHTGNIPKIAAFSPGCQETLIGSSVTSSLPRDWPGANPPSNHSRGVTSSTPCSPGETLERGKGRKRPPANQSVHGSCSPKHGSRKGHAKPKSSSQDSSRLFNTKLELLASRNNSLGRDFPALERRNSSKESVEAGYRGHLEGDCTFPRARKDPHPDQSYHFFLSESQSAKHAHSKLSAVGKPKTASPKVRRLSSPSIKNLSQSQKNLHETVNRSASLSPEIKTVSFERTSSFFSSSPPRSHRSISRTPSQSSTCSSSKSIIQGFVNGRISDLLRDRASSPTSAGLGHMTPVPSPYSQVTAPRSPDHLSGHASDTTSVLSGDLPPAMGKTLLHFSNRSSFVSSGYGSMVRDSEATGSSTSTRDSTSDRSSSLPGGARSSRSSRRRGNPGAHHPSNDSPQAVKSSSGSLRSRWTERGIPEAYDIKVYEIDDVQRMHKRAGSRMLQRQGEVFGASSAEDLRGPKEIQPPEERAGMGQTQSHAGVYQMEPRARPVANFRGGLPGAPGGP
ncbi:hypothetical protein OJAV_G00231410 [Oryzias javanicus]|uniref:Integrase catalytic domain-containing protein n=1 Tax=Oryzias javanicus TaxID=123683 RepID=A0A3S2MBS7_ORYJA|nr:hypothetical protein OJAV_G00231410 [Oryzias javanicus]